MRIRFLFIISFFVILYGLLEAQLFNLQVKKGDYYIGRVKAMEETRENLSFRRGQIFFTDRYNKSIPVGFNKEYPIIYAVPKEIQNPKETAEKLAPVIGADENDLEDVFNNPQSRFRLLIEKADDRTLNEVSQLKLVGIYTTKKKFRVYPFENLAAHIIGFVGVNDTHPEPVGLYGIEKFYESKLESEKNIQLAVDRNIQAEAEEILRGLVEKFKAVSGTVIVMEPSSGKIIAFANAPTFNPNTYGESPVASFLNPATQNTYEPGSVFKPFTMSAGIDLGLISPDTTFYDNGSVTLNGKTITNWDSKAHGKVTMTNVIEQSINTGAVFAVRKTGGKNFFQYLKKFGFGEVTGMDLPDEIGGSLKNLERKEVREIDYATASFGQGVSVTPIQLITAFSSIANGGLLMRPYLNAETRSYVVRRVMSAETSRKVTAMMESAVEKARVAALPHYRIAGKTGTAQIADLKNGGYAEEFNHTYVGFGPVSNPRFVALLRIEKPEATLAGQTVVPAFRELAQFILNYYNVPPDKIEKSKIQSSSVKPND